MASTTTDSLRCAVCGDQEDTTDPCGQNGWSTMTVTTKVQQASFFSDYRTTTHLCHHCTSRVERFIKELMFPSSSNDE